MMMSFLKSSVDRNTKSSPQQNIDNYYDYFFVFDFVLKLWVFTNIFNVWRLK